MEWFAQGGGKSQAHSGGHTLNHLPQTGDHFESNKYKQKMVQCVFLLLLEVKNTNKKYSTGKSTNKDILGCG